jgi:hypothetical protein
MIPRYLSLGAVCAVVFALAGCSGGGKPTAVPAGGKVLFNKTTPTVGALVVFHPVDPELAKRAGGNPFAKVRDDGTFVLTTFAEGDGAPEGEYGVTIDWRPAARDQKLSLGDGGAAGPSRLNPKYGNPKQPVLRATVKAGDPNQFVFDVD